ncbi:MAG: metallophosphoesterase [Chitinophagia bacterium]|nr:metallophosphoesterase [Chitinophagia bacterium]
MARNLRSLLVWLPLAVLPLLLRGQAPNIISGRPTDRSVTLSILMGQPSECIIDYGIAPGRYDSTSGPFPLQAGRPEERDLRNLLPDTRYWYRVRYRPLSAATYNVTPEYNLTTQRKPGRPFTFTLEADEHLYDKKGIRSMYQVVLQNQANDRPDFMISLGDTFGDDHLPFTITSAELAQLHLDYRPYLGAVCHSIPFYFCLGNHEGQNSYYLGLNPPNNLGVWGTLWRKYYYPNPFPDGFYTGNATQEPHGIGLPENYYAWTWGDALFVVLDVYRHQGNLDPKPQEWDWSLGRQQYDWLKATLRNSRAAFKFIFSHQIVGGSGTEGRGGTEFAHLYEMGGRNPDSSWGFAANRPGWDKPIHQLMVETGVNVFFHGHDHFFGRQVLDGVVYQEVPQPSAKNLNTVTGLAYGYAEGILLPSRGYILATVCPDSVKIDYIRTYLPNEENTSRRNGDIAHTYTIRKPVVTGVASISVKDPVRIYPNPAAGMLHVRFDAMPPRRHDVSIMDLQGRLLLRSVLRDIPTDTLPEGPCIVQVRTPDFVLNRRILIQH